MAYDSSNSMGGGSITKGGVPECTAKYYPNQGGWTPSEGEGAPGDKSVGGEGAISTGGLNGDFNDAPQAALASQHGRPAVSGSLEGVGEYSPPDEPTRGDGAVNTY